MTQHVHAKFNEKLDIFSFCSDHAKFSQKLVTFSLGHLALFTATQVFPCDLLPATLCDDNGNLCMCSYWGWKTSEVYWPVTAATRWRPQPHLAGQTVHNSPRICPTSDDIVCILWPLVAIYTPHTLHVQWYASNQNVTLHQSKHVNCFHTCFY